MKEQFRTFNFKPDTLAMIDKANVIIQELRAQGYMLTLRQLYYQLVSRDVIPNKQTEYKRLGSILNDARLAGMIDWESIEDRTRNLESVGHWNNAGHIIESCAYSFRFDKWLPSLGQKNRVEVWVEKDALVGVLEKACRPLDVAWFSCRGYTSQSELYSAGKRMAGYVRARQQPIVIHLGDHDPSGIDMTRDIQERLSLFAGQHVKVVRIALNQDQIDQYGPPPNPAKETDSRFTEYRKIHGDESWELDALQPAVIDALITKTVLDYRDDYAWSAAVAHEDRTRASLQAAADRWPEVADYLKGGESE